MQAFRCLSDFGKLVYLQHEHKRDKSIKSQYENLYIGASLGSIKSWLIATWSGWETTYKTARPISSGSKIFVFPLPSYCSRAYSNVQIWGKLEHKRNGTAAASARKEASLWVIVVAVSRFWDDCEVLETMYSKVQLHNSLATFWKTYAFWRCKSLIVRRAKHVEPALVLLFFVQSRN